MITGFQYFVLGIVFLGFASGIFSAGFKKRTTQKQNYFFTTLGILLAIPFVLFCALGLCKGVAFGENSLVFDLIFLFVILAVGFVCGFFLPWVGITFFVVYSILFVSFRISLGDVSPAHNFSERIELESPLENPASLSFQVLQIPRYLPFPVGEAWVCCSDSRIDDSCVFNLGGWQFVLDFLYGLQTASSEALIKTYQVTLPETPFLPLIYNVEFRNSCFLATILPY